MANDKLERLLDEYDKRYIKREEPIRSLLELKEYGVKGIDELIALKPDKDIKFPILVSPYYANLFKDKGVDSPLAKMVLPSPEEVLAFGKPGGEFDISGESINLKAPGLQHKYKSTAVLFVSDYCEAFCRFCFRKSKFIGDGVEYSRADFPNIEAIEYLQQHKEINTILNTGGDALGLNNDSIQELLDILSDDSLEHIKIVRFGSRMLAYQPSRIDEELGQILWEFSEKTGKVVKIGTHFNHPDEVTQDSIDASKLLTDHGVKLYTQTVLLKGVNDDPDTLYRLWHELASNKNDPHYLFQDRPVTGNEHFAVKLDDGLEIYNNVMKDLDGTSKPEFAMSTWAGKVTVQGFHPTKKDVMNLKFHSARDPNMTGKIIEYDINENPFWYYPPK